MRRRIGPGLLVAGIVFKFIANQTGVACGPLESRAWAQGAKQAAAVKNAAAPAQKPAPPQASAAAYLPDNLIAVVVLRNGDQHVEAFQKLLDEQGFADTPLYDMLMANPQITPVRIGLLGLAASAGTNGWSAVGALLGRELAIGLAPGEGKEPQFILVSVAREEELVQRLLKAVYALAGLVRGAGEPNPQKSEKIGDVVVYLPDKNVLHCCVDGAAIFTNSRELLKAALEARAGGKNQLAKTARYQACLKKVPADAVAWGYADMATIREKMMQGKPLPAQLPNPLGAFLFGGWWHTLRNADNAVLWAEAEKGALKISVRTETAVPLPETHRGLAPRDVRLPAWSAGQLPRFVAEFSVTRGWADLFSEREALLELPAAGDLVNFSNTVTTLLGGLDFTDEFLTKISGPVRLLLERQDFSLSKYDPTPKLPSFALVIPLKFPADSEFARRLHSGTQVAMSILNLDAGQKKEPQFLIDVDRYKGYRVLQAEYAAPTGEGMQMDSMARKDRKAEPGEGEKGDENKEKKSGDTSAMAANAKEKRPASVRYNFAPAAAVVEDQYVIATSADLLRHVIDAVSNTKQKNETAAKPSPEPPADFLTIAVPEVVKLLRENREELVTNHMLDKDKSKGDAEKDMDAFFAALDFFQKLEIRSQCDGREAKATVMVRLREKK